MAHLLETEGKRLTDGFPEDFLWGAAVSAKQAEGADGRGLSVADLQDFNPDDKTKVKGDLTMAQIRDRLDHPERYSFPKKLGIEFYHRYAEDIELLSGLGIKCFRFSVSWSRIFPNGDDAEPSEQGLAYYESLLDCLEEYDIEPIVTLYHDDMPVNLAVSFNGFLSEHVRSAFLRYAKVVMRRLAGRVRYWIPVNQINLTRVGLSSLGIVRDTVEDLDAKKLQGVHHKFVLCAKVAQIGRKIDPQNRFGAMLADFLLNPLTCKPEDVIMATRKNQMTMYFYADVQLRGRYPGYALHYFKENGMDVEVERGELELIANNAMDFLAVSYYNSNVVSAEKNTMAIGDSIINPYLEKNPWGWTVNPTGLLDGMLRYWDRYQVPIMIAENGFGQVEELGSDGTVHDDYRISYLRAHITAIREAVQSGVEMFAYCLWSPIDMVSSGTSEMRKRYGLIYNDQDDYGNGSHRRYPKDSYYWYRDVVASNGKNL